MMKSADDEDHDNSSSSSSSSSRMGYRVGISGIIGPIRLGRKMTSNHPTAEIKDAAASAGGKKKEMPKLEQDRMVQRRLYQEGKGWLRSKDFMASISRILQEKIFPKVKILSDQDNQFLAPDFVGYANYDQSRLIAEILIREFFDRPRAFDYKVNFWITYRSFVQRQIMEYQNSCVEEMKSAYFKARSVLSSLPENMDENAANRRHEGCRELMDVLADRQREDASGLIRLRGENGRKLAFFYFARKFLPCVTKEYVFLHNKLDSHLSEFVTVADEAFALLILDGNVAQWNSMYNDMTSSATTTTATAASTQSSFPSTTQTDHQHQSADDGKKHSGQRNLTVYGYKALNRYNEYYDSIERARRNMTVTFHMEQELMDKMQALENDKMSRKRARSRKKNEKDKPTRHPCRAKYDL